MSESPSSKRAKTEEPVADMDVAVDDSNLIRVEVDNGGDFDEEFNSPEKVIAGFPWAITVSRLESETSDDIMMCVECKLPDDADNNYSWFAYVTSRIKLINFDDDKKSKKLCWSDRLHVNNTCTVPISIPTSELKKGFLRNNKFIVQATLEVHTCGKRRYKTYDFSAPHKRSDVVLIVEGKK
ncbi:hypothetical protein PFISCL1PPCAC_21048, partial [Pristionchus fissidentatus]